MFLLKGLVPFLKMEEEMNSIIQDHGGLEDHKSRCHPLFLFVEDILQCQELCMRFCVPSTCFEPFELECCELVIL